jgi:hypothetical protein
MLPVTQRVDYVTAFGRRSTWTELALATVISAIVLLVGWLVFGQVYCFVLALGLGGGYAQAVRGVARERDLSARRGL